jgi:urea transport system substrate-binding protein
MLSLAMEESTRERVGDRVSRDVWSAFGYYSSLENDANSDLRGRYLERHGRWAPPISTFSEGVYEAIILYARAAVAARGDGDEVLRRLARLRGDLPRGQVELFGHQDMRQKIHVARFTEQGYRMAEG